MAHHDDHSSHCDPWFDHCWIAWKLGGFMDISWISIFMYRRRLLSLMSLTFEVLSSGLGKGDVVRLSDELKDELWSMIVCGPLSYVNLRAKTAGTIRATDSSGWGAAAVRADIPIPIAREALRHSLTKSSWTHLLPPLKAWKKLHQQLDIEEELPEGEPYSTHPMWAVLARCPSYVETWRRPHPRQMHINCTELSAHLREESRLAANFCSTRFLYGLDSQVSLGSLVKGRSASKALNALLQRSLPFCIGSDLYAGLGFFPSSLNRADGPTRSLPPAAPDLPLPSWWTSASEGDFVEFDSWLHQQEVESGVFPAAKAFDFSALGYKETPVLTTGRTEHARNHFKKRAQGLPPEPANNHAGGVECEDLEKQVGASASKAGPCNAAQWCSFCCHFWMEKIVERRPSQWSQSFEDFTFGAAESRRSCWLGSHMCKL